MEQEVVLVNDGDGIALIGDKSTVDLFLRANELQSREISLEKFQPLVAATGSALLVGSELAANSGRWIKLTEKSAKLLKQGTAMAGSSANVSRTVLVEGGKTKHILEFTKSVANPSVLAGVGGIMAQVAMQQALDEITDYLARIEGKVEDVLRAQKDKVLSEIIGVGLVIDDAMVIRSQVGRVSETTWSKVQGASSAIANTQSYALRQLDAIAEKLERKRADKDLKAAITEAEKLVPEWLSVIARCFQLESALGVLELDRVLEESPSELDAHRQALQLNRAKRNEVVAVQITRLLDRVSGASQTAFKGILIHPLSARSISTSASSINALTEDFAEHMGFSADRFELQQREWMEAAIEKRDEIVKEGAKAVDAVVERGVKTVDAITKFTEDVSEKFAQRNSSDKDDS